MPYGLYASTTARDPNLAIVADRNPWIRSPAAEPASFSLFVPDIPPFDGSAEMARAGNAIAHQNDGQNVLFLDGRVNFETRSFCGLDQDNIYTISSNVQEGDPHGWSPPTSQFDPTNGRDSVLVHDPPSSARR